MIGVALLSASQRRSLSPPAARRSRKPTSSQGHQSFSKRRAETLKRQKVPTGLLVIEDRESGPLMTFPNTRRTVSRRHRELPARAAPPPLMSSGTKSRWMWTSRISTKLLKTNLEKVVQHGQRADGIVKNMLLHSRESSGEMRSVDLNTAVEEGAEPRLPRRSRRQAGVQRPAGSQRRPHRRVCSTSTRRNSPVSFSGPDLATASTRFGLNGTPRLRSGFEPALTVSTEALTAAVAIRVRDNGAGVNESVKASMFEPFFTTKPLAKAPALALAQPRHRRQAAWRGPLTSVRARRIHGVHCCPAARKPIASRE